MTVSEPKPIWFLIWSETDFIWLDKDWIKLSKFLNYGRIVDNINSSIGQDPNAVSLIGVLDIYGFESFKINRYIINRKTSLQSTEIYIEHSFW